MTVRAVCVGLFFSIAINLVMGYNDWYLHNTLLIGNHFPYIAIAILMLLIVGVNLGIVRRFGGTGFSAGELMLIWGMIGVAGGIGSAGLMRYYPSYMTTPAYYATNANEWNEHLLKYLPDWMVVSKDSNSPAVRWFLEGLPRGAGIPWVMWARPMAMWFGFMLLLYASNFALVSIFFHHWSDRERLIFPAVQVPAMMAEPAPLGERLNAFFRNRLTWIGIAIPIVIWSWDGLRSYVPELPNLPMAWYSWSIFPDRPWSEMHLENVNIYFTVIGLTFLLTTEIAFSFWFFYVLYKASFVWVAWMGTGGTGFTGDWAKQITVYENAGAMLAVAGFLCWSARRTLAAWWGRVFSGERDPQADPLAPRLALLLLVGGVAGMIGWFLYAQAQWWAAIIGVVMFLVVLLVMTRIVTESGLIFVQTNVIPYDLVTGLFPPGWISGFTLTSLAMQKGVHMFDLREIFMPYAMNGLKGTTQARVSMGKVLGVFMLTAVVAIGAAAYAKIASSYKFGGVNMDQGANAMFPSDFLGAAAKFDKERDANPNYPLLTVGDRHLMPVSVAHFVLGGLITAGMFVLRAQFLWWPLHPFGLIMCGTWAMTMFWFSFLIGWVLKASVMRFGGASMFRKLLPLFLGLAIGESLAAAFWAIVGLVTGTPGIYILPY